MGKLIVVVGGQFGSEAKGTVAAHLSRTEDKPMAAIRVAGPNAGHTVYDAEGREFKLRQIPVAAVTNPAAQLLIAAGSEVDEAVLTAEIETLEAAGHMVRSRLHIDPQATVLGPQHIVQEQGLSARIGSTAKGIGAARADRIFRQAELWGSDGEHVSSAALARLTLARGGTVLVEGTQGYGLGLHAGYYPYCTSSDCRAVDFLGMAGLSPWDQHVTELEVWITVRTRPIRVAGNSGPLLGETSWEDLGFEPETTTVTGKIRRVGEWDSGLVWEAIRANGGPSPSVRLALTFLDYDVPEAAGATEIGDGALRERLDWYARQVYPVPIELVGTGPQSMIDLR